MRQFFSNGTGAQDMPPQATTEVESTRFSLDAEQSYGLSYKTAGYTQTVSAWAQACDKVQLQQSSPVKKN